ncbi:helix-turn-helix transcriptional regulator [Nocardioides panaciterrulae]|uniref:Putative DNA-binding transcriptional regulator YafY n=1 Tax=Nocardioides panaciterrulae TaxID=661492 RepID=A0A7Y9E8R5_9ACTN|nr:WYL domain-containing protein [Nocardioides panaciterrulae]NYD43199.1 putative DNA-binding transcriptional regulator YafY [Nocardioides panaciterrulae]
MPDTATRLLSLLQGDRDWTGGELAERLGVSGRTVRTDVDRLRELGYDVRATPGVGGYRLGHGGTSLPPLLLDRDEAVAVAVGLRTGVNCIIGGMEETSVRALAKLERVLPARLRQQVRLLNRYTVPLPSAQPAPVVDPAVLTELAGRCDRRERVRFWYDAAPAAEAEGDRAAHEVEPHRLLSRGHRWYLLGFDVAADRWAAFEVHRLHPRVPAGPRFEPRDPPGDVEGQLAELLPRTTWRHEASVTLHAPAADVALLSAEGVLEPMDDRRCRARIGGETLTAIALTLARLGVDFTVHDPPELVEAVRRLGERFGRATQADPR